MAIGVVYIWFGALKIAGLSPAAQLVRDTVPFTIPEWFVPAVGAAEAGIGLWFVSGRALHYAAPVFAAHMTGTLAVLVLLPEQAFRHGHVWELTTTGEFVVKNLVLLSAGLHVCLTPVPSPSTHPEPEGPTSAVHNEPLSTQRAPARRGVGRAGGRHARC
ncbi:hypothetical protein [Streptomyces sp. NPDC001537]